MSHRDYRGGRSSRSRDDSRSPPRDRRYSRHSPRRHPRRDERDRYDSRDRRDDRDRHDSRDHDRNRDSRRDSRSRYSPYRDDRPDRSSRGRPDGGSYRDYRSGEYISTREREERREREFEQMARERSSRPSPPPRAREDRGSRDRGQKREKSPVEEEAMQHDYPEGSMEAMMASMGLPVSFDTTKQKKVEGNVEGAAQSTPQFKYRQYMNRRGGFNRPLDPI